MKKILYLFILLLSIFLIAFFSINKDPIKSEKVITDNKPIEKNDSNNSKYYFIYSHPYEDNTILSSTNDGKSFNDEKINVNDVFTIQENQIEDSIFLIPTHENIFYELKNEKELVENQVSGPLNFLVNNNDIQIKSYNLDLNTNKLEINDVKNNKKFSLDFQPYLADVYYNDDYIFLLNDMLNEPKTILHIINRKDGIIEDSIDLNSTAQDILEFNNQLVISTEEFLTVVSLKDLNKKTIPYSRGNIFPDELHIWNDKLYLSYGDYIDQSLNLAVFDKDFNIIKEQNLKVLFTKVKFKDSNLYVLLQHELEDKTGGVFTAFNLDKISKDFEFSLPKKDIKVQDFLIKHSESASN